MVVALCLFISAQAYSAEAFDSGTIRAYLPQPLAYQRDAFDITTHQRRSITSASDTEDFTAISNDIRARYQMAIDDARQTELPATVHDIAARFAQNFATANGFHLISPYPDPSVTSDSIYLSRDDAAAFLSLPQAGERLLASHFIQPLFGTDYVIWPHHQIQPLDSLSYHSPLSAMVRYGDGQIATPFTGQITLSFDSFDGHISLSADQNAFDLFFTINAWQNAMPLHLDALLHHGGDSYSASLLLAYTNLPHSAIWGNFRNHQTAPTTPQDGHFTNFEIPKN